MLIREFPDRSVPNSRSMGVLRLRFVRNANEDFAQDDSNKWRAINTVAQDGRVLVMDDKKFWVYIVCSRFGTLYVGMTNNTYRRAPDHKSGEFEGFASKDHCTRIAIRSSETAWTGESALRSIGHYPARAFPNSAALSPTLSTCFGSGNRLPSSRIGMSLSNSGPECDPVITIRMG